MQLRGILKVGMILAFGYLALYLISYMIVHF
ncbi:hypothetical protein X915_gp004 [Bacillus phage vB_BanS-Tsamsa]|uniref:Uncharacterized protein n=1 Tax=Bacillus phage vB_BanS-Tsamsa TaxID=1308863 RepID=U5J9M1_9CAUD|nr:hypothetical protein X915_gp004 [Bacillus phage vB_BanS-Tsamsa]AGI11993.1 hypothetical protein [Bacillus phage vB_BanS-Tsamsa]